MMRILLLLTQPADRQAICTVLTSRFEISVPASDAEALAEPFDLCLIDSPTLERLNDALQARKTAEAPRFLPLVLLTPHSTMRQLTKLVWDHVDEVVSIPTDTVRLLSRITLLLHTRQLSVETEQLRAELDATVNSIADGVIVYAATGDILHTNQAAERLLGYTVQERAESVAERWLTRHAKTPDSLPIPPEAIPTQRALQGEVVHGVIVMFPQAVIGDLWLSVSAAPIRTPDGQTHGVVATYTDITALHHLQEQQKALLQTISHDLRAPLSVIKGHEQVVASTLEEQGVNGTIQQSLASIDRSVNRMDGMIQDLVDATRWESGQLELQREAVNLPRYLADLLQRMSMALDTTRIQMAVPADLPLVSADYARLERILVNLLSNALKYSDPGTPVCLRAWQEEGEVVVAVSDQGRGIAPEDMPHLFQRFYRTADSRKVEGIGLGLFITRMLVEAHGGRIWVKSEVGKGSTFYLTLPVVQEEGSGADGRFNMRWP